MKNSYPVYQSRAPSNLVPYGLKTAIKNKKFISSCDWVVGNAHCNFTDLRALKYGHPAGDRVLKTVAELLKKNSRVTDIVARYGGEKFAMILPGTTMNGALQLGKKLRKAFLSHPFEHKALTVT